MMLNSQTIDRIRYIAEEVKGSGAGAGAGDIGVSWAQHSIRSLVLTSHLNGRAERAGSH